MKKKLQLEGHDREREILKAVAQAWYSHSSSSRPMSEFDAHWGNFEGRLPSRFKREAMRKSPSASHDHHSGSATWDFGQSLWDAYEIVAVSKRLETGLVFEDNPVTEMDGPARDHRKRKESNHSLRSLFDKMSSGRFNEVNVPPDDDT